MLPLAGTVQGIQRWTYSTPCSSTSSPPLTGVCALAVVVTQNIVRAAAWLLFALAGISGIFFLLGADFVGATQLLVYVGGTLVLVVFGVMLTAQGPFINMRIGAAEWAIALAVGLLLYGVLAVSLVISKPPTAAESADAGRRSARQHRPRRMALLGDKTASPAGQHHRRARRHVTPRPHADVVPAAV